jgi:hypothetical protein
MRQVIKVVDLAGKTAYSAEEDIAVVWESMALPNGLKPGLRNMWTLTGGKVALLFDYSLNGGATILEPSPTIAREPECHGTAPDGGSNAAHPLFGFDQRDGISGTCVHCGEPASEHPCPAVPS